jgi:hypothetical protein
MKTAIIPLITAAIALLTQELAAADLVRLESRYLGDGIFEYVLEFPDDRYFDKVNFDAFHVGGLQDQAVTFLETPPHWTEVLQGWKHDQMIWESVPYRRTFRVRSTTTSYRLSTATMAWGQHWFPWAAPEGTANSEETPPREIAYATFMCLSPCEPGEADGSPPEYISTVPGYPDLRIHGVVLEWANRNLSGLMCEVGAGLPVVVETSNDMENWVPVGEVVGANGMTSWLADPAPDQAIRFFRIVVKR